MKKIIKVVLCYVMMFTLTVLTFGNECTVYAASQKSLEKKATKYLNTSSKECEEIMSTIYNSWYFQVYRADDFYNESIVSAYSEETGIPQSEVKSIVNTMTIDIFGEIDGAGIAAIIQVLDSNLDIVDTYYRQKGTFKKINNNLRQAKKIIIKLKNKSRKKKFQNYYNAVNKYYKYVSNPSGSFAQLGDKKSSLDEKVEDCKDALSW